MIMIKMSFSSAKRGTGVEKNFRVKSLQAWAGQEWVPSRKRAPGQRKTLELSMLGLGHGKDG